MAHMKIIKSLNKALRKLRFYFFHKARGSPIILSARPLSWCSLTKTTSGRTWLEVWYYISVIICKRKFNKVVKCLFVFIDREYNLCTVQFLKFVVSNLLSFGHFIQKTLRGYFETFIKCVLVRLTKLQSSKMFRLKLIWWGKYFSKTYRHIDIEN